MNFGGRLGNYTGRRVPLMLKCVLGVPRHVVGHTERNGAVTDSASASVSGKPSDRSMNSDSIIVFFRRLHRLNDSEVTHMSRRRKRFTQRLIARIEKWDHKLDELASKRDQIHSDFRHELDERVSLLREKRDDLKSRLHGTGASTKTAWKEMKKGLDEAFSDFKRGVRRARKAYKPQSTPANPDPRTPPETA